MYNVEIGMVHLINVRVLLKIYKLNFLFLDA